MFLVLQLIPESMEADSHGSLNAFDELFADFATVAQNPVQFRAVEALEAAVVRRKGNEHALISKKLEKQSGLKNHAKGSVMYLLFGRFFSHLGTRAHL